MKINLVAYIDANYLPKFLICYNSLQKHFNNRFVMHLHCFDNITYNILKEYNLPNLELYSKQEFEIIEALAQKNNKKSYEYFWTYTPIVLEQIMGKVNENDLVVYLDTDMMFFNSPQVIFDEIEDKDVLIQPNNFSVKERWQFDPIGYYCTSFNVFRNNDNSRKIVKEWKEQCLNWCGADFKTGQFGDQKYMDYWRDQYEKVREVTVVGANVAPWNIHKFDVSTRDGNLYINNNPLVYYHFHAFKMNFDDLSYMIEGDRDNHYEIRQDAIDNIYAPYIERYKEELSKLKTNELFNKYIKVNPTGSVGWYENESELGKIKLLK